MLEIIIETHCSSSGACPTPPLLPPPIIYDPLIRSFSWNPYGSIKGELKKGRHNRLVPNCLVSCGPQKGPNDDEWVCEKSCEKSCFLFSSSWDFILFYFWFGVYFQFF